MDTITEDAVRDALAYIRAQLTGDLDGMATLITNGDPARMLAASTSILNGLALHHYGSPAAVVAWLDDLQSDPVPPC